MARFFSARYQALFWLTLNLLLLWLLLQLYARHLVQQHLVEFNQQYQLFAHANGWPLWQLHADQVRVLPWRDELQVQQLQLSLPSGAVLLEVSGIRWRGLITSALGPHSRYQLHWEQLQPSVAVRAWLGPQWQTLLKPLSGSIQWQQLQGQQQQNQWQIKSRFVMADVAAVLVQLRLQSLQDPQLGTGLKVDQLVLELQQQGLADMLSALSDTQRAVIQQQLQQWQQQLAMPLPPQQQQCEIVRSQLSAVLSLWPLQPKLQFQLQKPVIWWFSGVKNRLTAPLISCENVG